MLHVVSYIAAAAAAVWVAVASKQRGTPISCASSFRMHRPVSSACVRWALVGTGDFAVDWIAPSLQRADSCKLVAVVSRNMARARDVAVKLGVALAYSSIDDIDLNEVLPHAIRGSAAALALDASTGGRCGHRDPQCRARRCRHRSG
jgi:hypothetical protein